MPILAPDDEQKSSQFREKRTFKGHFAISELLSSFRTKLGKPL